MLNPNSTSHSERGEGSISSRRSDIPLYTQMKGSSASVGTILKLF